MSTGYIKLFRSLKQSSFYKDSEYVHLWVHLLMSVNRIEKRLKVDKTNQFVDLHPGQVLTSRDKLAEQTGIHRSKVDRILKAFISEQQIEQQTFSKYRVISILNWWEYQVGEQQPEHETSTKRAASEQQVSTNKKEEKEKKGEKEPKACTPTENALRECMADNREMLAGKYPHVDLDIELEEMVSKYRKVSIGADAFLIVSRWLKNLPPKRESPLSSDSFASIMKGVKL